VAFAGPNSGTAYFGKIHGLRQRLQEADVRGYVDHRDEKIGRKIRDAEVNKLPYMLIVGEKEQADGTISVRRKGHPDMGAMTLEDFVTSFKTEIQSGIATFGA
jgi:threonyl-tRNA synthetase